MKLSKNLTLSEVCASSEAVKRGIPNIMSEAQLSSWKWIAKHLFQPVRDSMDKPITILSGYRSIMLNRHLIQVYGASLNSQHRGHWKTDDTEAKIFPAAALDLWLPDPSDRLALFMYYYERREDEAFPFDQLINEMPDGKTPTWIHISCVLENTASKEKFKMRRQILSSGGSAIRGQKFSKLFKIL